VTVITFLPGSSFTVYFHAAVPLAVSVSLRVFTVTLVTAPVAAPLIRSLSFVVVTFFLPLIVTTGAVGVYFQRMASYLLVAEL